MVLSHASCVLPPAFVALQHFVSEFILPLRARLSAGSNAGISAEDLGAISSNVESLCSFHILFLRELQVESEIAAAAGTHPNLARIFQAYADWFKLYVSYLNNYSAMIHALDHARTTSPKFARFITEEFAHKTRRDSASMSQSVRGHAVVLGKGVVVGGIVAPQTNTVASAASAVVSAAQQQAPSQPQQQQALAPMDYLIQPVQRLPRYVLLLSSLLRHTPASDTLHHSTIQAALSKIESVASFVNERKRDAENMARLCSVAERISGGLPEDIHLLQPHRRLVREGAVMVLSSRSLLGFDLLGSSLKVSRVNLLLFNDLLIWTNEKGKYKGGFDLAQTTVSGGGGGGGATSGGGAGPITGGAAGASGATLDSMFQISDPKANILCKCNSQWRHTRRDASPRSLVVEWQGAGVSLGLSFFCRFCFLLQLPMRCAVGRSSCSKPSQATNKKKKRSVPARTHARIDCVRPRDDGCSCSD